MATNLRARRIAVIGAGPTGVATAKYLLAEKAFDKITVYEQGSHVGGLWQATPDLNEEESFTLPSTTPSQQPDRPVWPGMRPEPPNGSDSDRSRSVSGSSSPDAEIHDQAKKPIFVSPIYDRLETNIPRSLMRFSDHFFADDTQLFPKHETVQHYIEEYAKEIRHLSKFETQVLDVRWHRTREPDSKDSEVIWKVQTRDLRTREELVETYDAVVCATGHYATPYVPAIPGIEEWARKYPDSISHAKYYRRPEAYRNKKVLVIGNFASGSDIGNQILPYCKQPLLVSARSPSEMFSASSTKRELPSLSRFDIESGSVEFEGGHKEQDVDHVLFCTGYLYSFPFLQSLDPPLVTDGAHVRNTYQHLFYAPQPTLTLPALPQKVIPFPISEAQAAVIARYYSGRLDLSSYHKMRQWEQQRLEAVSKGENKSRAAFHKMPFPADAEYINMLSDWAASAEREGEVGKTPRKWGEWECWCRARFPEIKKAFNERGEDRWKVTSLEELGFDFERWKSEQAVRE